MVANKWNMEYGNTHYFTLPKIYRNNTAFSDDMDLTLSPPSLLQSAQPDFPKVIVIGGSLGGLFAAIALRSVNCDVEVFEKSPVNMKGRGAGIVMQMEIVNFLSTILYRVPKCTCLQKTVFEKRWHNRVRRAINAINDFLGITLSCVEGNFPG